ncbi:MAG: efflux transporter outer membrane subunit [Candidatus Sumerlaeia bacterium]|nr:efflux transporter outer membrane subunit [Candidatus Sumerlaeia bacterium]
MLRRLPVFLAVILLAGCVLGPNYQRPERLAAESFREPAAVAGDAATTDTLLAAMPWWEVFEDERLQQLIGTALENNHDLMVAASRIEEARALLGITASEAAPHLSAGGSASRTRMPNGELPPVRANSYATLLDLSYEVDLWGRVRRSREAARAEVLASELDREALVSTIVTDVARTYFTLLELDREQQVATATLETRRRTLHLMELRREHGVASELDVSRARAELAATRATLSSLREAVFGTENALAILLGLAPHEMERGADFAGLPPIPRVPVGLPSELLERRPDIRSAEQRLAAATARIGAAKAAFFPRIALTANAGLRSAELGDLLEANSRTWAIAGTAAQPIFDGRRNWFNYQATKARQEQALHLYRRAVLQALREVSDALMAREQADQRVADFEEQVAALATAVRLSRSRYEAGESGYLDVLDAERQLFAAELQVERARLDALLASVRLYKALGGGVAVEPPADPTGS